MIVPWLIFIAVGLIIYAGFVKLAARLVGYKVSWKSSFLFAAIMLVLVLLDHLLAAARPVPVRTINVVVLLLVLVILGGWFFGARGIDRNGALIGWGGGIRLVALAFAIMVIVAFAIALSAQLFLSKHLSSPP
jgi:hypothetical protein